MFGANSVADARILISWYLSRDCGFNKEKTQIRINCLQKVFIVETLIKLSNISNHQLQGICNTWSICYLNIFARLSNSEHFLLHFVRQHFVYCTIEVELTKHINCVTFTTKLAQRYSNRGWWPKFDLQGSFYFKIVFKVRNCADLHSFELIFARLCANELLFKTCAVPVENLVKNLNFLFFAVDKSPLQLLTL